ncbi:MAG: uracil-DNA glycosylase [Anaerolineaceae bacterium]|nr:uracil-DNA glycosylase [Anaerolineaceae bacterium]
MNTWKELEENVIRCHKCARLVALREEVARTKRRAYMDCEYWGKPIPGFGDTKARLLILGLAPGAHGSNRTGRMFTGDASGVFLFAALHRAGFANLPESTHRQDGLQLSDIFITAVGRCAPPGNKPTRGELENCLPFLLKEIELLQNMQGVVALGQIAFKNILDIYTEQTNLSPRPSFSHGAFYHLGENLPWLLASYHPSRQNTQTGRLTQGMFDHIWDQANQLLS